MLTLADDITTYSPTTPKPRVPCLDASNRYHATRCNARPCQAPFTEACRAKVGAQQTEQRLCKDCGQMKDPEEFGLYRSGQRKRVCRECRRREDREREAAKRQARKG